MRTNLNRSVKTTVRLSPAERERLERVARLNRRTLSDFLRLLALDRADEVLGVSAEAELVGK